MENPHTEARDRLRRLTSAWLDGDRAAVAEFCLPTVRWWSPLLPTGLHGPDRVGAHLDALLQDAARRVEVTALLMNESGTRGVVEMLAPGDGDTPDTVLTSVVRMSEGQVAEGRTYADVKAHPSLIEVRG